MRPSQLVGFALLFLYAVWAAALQGVLASPRWLGEWTPDLGLVLLLAWAGKLADGRAPLAALCVALARALFGADPPIALAASTLGALGLSAALRTGLEVDRGLARALLCGVGAWLSARLLLGARALALASEAPAVGIEHVRLWPGALATAGACLVLAPLFLRLPGLPPLARKRP